MDLPNYADWYSSRPMNISADFIKFKSSIEYNNELYALNIEYKEGKNHSLHLAVYQTTNVQNNPIETLEIENFNYDDIPESDYVHITHTLGGNDNHSVYTLVTYKIDNGQKRYKILLHRFEYFIDPDKPIQHEIIYNFWSDIFSYKMDIDNQNRIYLYPYPGSSLEKDNNGNEQLIIPRIDGQSTSYFDINLDFDCPEGFEHHTLLSFLGTRYDGTVYLFINQRCYFNFKVWTEFFVRRIYDFSSDINNPIDESISQIEMNSYEEIAMNKGNQNVYVIQRNWNARLAYLHKIDQNLNLSTKEITNPDPNDGLPRFIRSPNIYFDFDANCLIMIENSWDINYFNPKAIAINYQNGEIEDIERLSWSIELPQVDEFRDFTRHLTQSAVYFKKDGINRIATVGPNIICRHFEDCEPENNLTLVVFKEEEEEEEEEDQIHERIIKIFDLYFLRFLKFLIDLSMRVFFPIVPIVSYIKTFIKKLKVIFKKRITQKDKKDGL
ncbi:hypothetical protein ES706_04229 [subsurface metagenome]